MTATRNANGNLIFNRKSNAVLDALLVLIVIIVMAIFTTFSYKILSDINTDIQTDALMSNQTKEMVQETTDYYPSFMDSIFIFAFVLVWGMVLVASFMIDSHPVFFIFSLILIIFVLVGAAYLSNGYQELMADSDISSYAAVFPMTNFIINNLVQTILAIATSILIVLFAKSRT